MLELEKFEDQITIDNFHNLSNKLKKIIFDERIDIIERLTKETINNTKRFDHSLSVANVMSNLAKKHHIDPYKAYLAGLLHDITKYLPLEDQYAYLKCYDQDKLDAPKGILHSYTAKYFIKEKFNFYDKDILNAIYHHADGECKSKMAMMLYIADKRDPLRNLDPKILNIAYDDLYLAFKMMKDDVKEYLNNKNDGIN